MQKTAAEKAGMPIGQFGSQGMAAACRYQLTVVSLPRDRATAEAVNKGTELLGMKAGGVLKGELGGHQERKRRTDLFCMIYCLPDGFPHGMLSLLIHERGNHEHCC